MSFARSIALSTMLLAVSCKADTVTPTEVPVPGTLTIQLSSPNSGEDVGALLSLSAPEAPRSVTAEQGLTMWGGSVGKIALTGVLSEGMVLTLEVDDVNQVELYSATLLEVAASGDYTLRDLTGYSLTVTR